MSQQIWISARTFRKHVEWRRGILERRWSRSDGYLIRSTTIKANSKIVRERIGINRFAIEIEFQPLYPDPGALLHEASDAVNL